MFAVRCSGASSSRGVGRRLAAGTVAASVAVLIAACGSSSSSSSSGGSTSSASSSSGHGSKTVIGFVPASSDPYQEAWQKGARQAAAEGGFTIKFIEDNRDQTAQNQQVIQELGSGVKPAAWVWDPQDAAAGAATLAQLHATGVPVFQMNQYPPANTVKYITAYAGVNDFLNGRTSGELILKARAALKAKEGHLHSPGGNIAILLFDPGFAAGIDRAQGFDQVTKGSGLNVIATGNSAEDSSTGYSVTTSLLPTLKAKGLDLLYAQNDDAAQGAIKALEAAGYKPGKNVMVVGGNCESNTSYLTSGQQFGTGLQAAELEGYFSFNRLGAYLKNPEVKPGMYYAPSTANSQPTFPTEVSQYNFLPNPGVLGTQVGTTMLWGHTMQDLCNY
jgi:ABC-type sugar transport system substrate-binding protein